MIRDIFLPHLFFGKTKTLFPVAGALSTMPVRKSGLGLLTRLETYFDSLEHQGPERGYQLNPTKSVMIVRPENLEAGKLFGAHHGFRVCTGARYLGGYIGGNESKHDWSRERTLM